MKFNHCNNSSLAHLFISKDYLILVHFGKGLKHQEELGLTSEPGLLVQYHVGGDVGGVDEALGRRGDWRGKTHFSSEKIENMIRDRPYHAEQMFMNFSKKIFFDLLQLILIQYLLLAWHYY